MVNTSYDEYRRLIALNGGVDTDGTPPYGRKWWDTLINDSRRAIHIGLLTGHLIKNGVPMSVAARGQLAPEPDAVGDERWGTW
jgi:hypothetical protein